MSFEHYSPIILAIVLALIAILPALWTLIQTRKKIAAEVEKIEKEADKFVTEAALSLIGL